MDIHLILDKNINTRDQIPRLDLLCDIFLFFLPCIAVSVSVCLKFNLSFGMRTIFLSVSSQANFRTWIPLHCFIVDCQTYRFLLWFHIDFSQIRGHVWSNYCLIWGIWDSKLENVELQWYVFVMLYYCLD